ncbi:hypothetical protein BX616_000941 [Lobosporangium transversale]|uniref:tRNA(Ile)-lysidine synthetase n=1 Tax=Lobosporangium transversale TaxID=64571 RepID=A0A1Y2GQ33_9FUNG|nr:PP-loop family-domain-containing protein [Lobosporangium transversale]KAF9905680.1 hypothetical protein BX616_000941 [Lobosporangium transversale]ORZ16704.1 PP-loop family-domain-containing protein [Lobosporangium transversale]|eukprot:XP_021881639.1 PP-loop family-domain-containing protein [Lobosporangium transversale]
MTLSKSTALAITAKEFARWLSPLYSRQNSIASCLEQGLPNNERHKSHSMDQNPTDIHQSRLESKDHNIAIAVSGGVDSMALVTLLAKHYYPTQDRTKQQQLHTVPTKLHALIVDHKLRDGSSEEAAFVAQQVQRLNVTPHVLTLDWIAKDKNSGQNQNHQNDDNDEIYQLNRPSKVHLETRAREERYRVIAQKCHELGVRDLFVGHHSGDQVETVIFRFARASGIDGLAGIQEDTPLSVVNVPEGLNIQIIRPLLKATKDRLKATCNEAGTRWVEDPSNKSLDYQRNVIRHFQQDIDACVEKDPNSELSPLSSKAWLEFRARMDQHRRAAWDQVRPWLRNIFFDSANGVCYVKLQATSTSEDAIRSTSIPTKVEWLERSQNHVAMRLVSYLIHWVNCKDHAPRSEDVQMLLKQLKKPYSVIGSYFEATRMKSVCDSSTKSIQKKKRASNRSSAARQQDISSKFAIAMTDSHSEAMSLPPINLAGVQFSPPRSTKGLPDYWTLARQPMSRADRKAVTIAFSIGGDNEEAKRDIFFDESKQSNEVNLLWDQRFFLKIQSSSFRSVPNAPSRGRIYIKPMRQEDASIIQKLEASGQLEQSKTIDLHTWMTAVPGSCRFTVPVVYLEGNSGDTGAEPRSQMFLSLPTLGLHMKASPFAIQSYFKSKHPVDGPDMACLKEAFSKMLK